MLSDAAIDGVYAAAASGSVAELPITRSRELPMFTRIPVKSIVSTRFDRPNEMNGSVNPVVGSSPITTPMWRNAVSTVVNVSPTATSWRNGSSCLARDAKSQQRIEGERQRDRGNSNESPLLADIARHEIADTETATK